MINGKIIKVCGMREAENIQDVESIEGIDMLDSSSILNLPDMSTSFRLTCPFMPGVSEFSSTKTSR